MLIKLVNNCLTIIPKLAKWLIYSKVEKAIARKSMNLEQTTSLLTNENFEDTEERERGREGTAERENEIRIRKHVEKIEIFSFEEELKPTGRDKCEIRATVSYLYFHFYKNLIYFQTIL